MREKGVKVGDMEGFLPLMRFLRIYIGGARKHE